MVLPIPNTQDCGNTVIQAKLGNPAETRSYIKGLTPAEWVLRAAHAGITPHRIAHLANAPGRSLGYLAGMGLLLLSALQTVLMAAGFVILWRRIERQNREIGQLRAALDALETRRGGRVAARGTETVAILPVEAGAVHAGAASARAARAWARGPDGEAGVETPTLSPETGRSLVLGLLAAAPAAGFFMRAETTAIVAAGLGMAAAMMLIALRPMWRVAAWSSVLTAGAWATLGFALKAAQAEPVSYASLVTLAAGAGLVHAHLRRAAPGATLALGMSVALLALGSQTAMVGPPGVAFAIIVAMAAIVGALTARLEGVLLASFGAALIGLFVMSGQHEAAIWFTPAAAWAGALFLALAFVRAPVLGPRAGLTAGLGALAPAAAIGALHAAQHGLAERWAAAAAFATLALCLAAIIILAAQRRRRGLQRLHLTLWQLALGAFVAIASALLLAAPAPLAAAAFAAVAAALLLLNRRWPHAVWQFLACAAGAGAAALALLTARLVLAEAATMPAWVALAAGFGAAALLAGASAHLAERGHAPMSATWFETIAIVLTALGGSLALRLFYSAGAPLLAPVSLAEAGAHCAWWLAVALALAARAHRGASAVRRFYAPAFGLAAAAAIAAAGLNWALSPAAQSAAAAELWRRDSLGFALPAALFWAHWVLWRASGAGLQTRAALGAAALLSAAFIAIEAVRNESAPEWASGLVSALALAAALGVNFAPGVTLNAARR